jgi:uncharacterized protein YraI
MNTMFAPNASTLLSRRALVRSAARGAAGLAIAGVAGQQLLARPARAQDVSVAAIGPFRTTAALNMRTQPSLAAPIILVIPYQAEVTAVGPEQNGFVNVSYNGKGGWAYGQYLTVSQYPGGEIPQKIGTGTLTAAVNFRSGPSLSHSVKRVLPQGATVDIFDKVQNNFRMVGYAAETGWVYTDYISAGGSQPGTLTTTAALNLRSQPSLSGQVLKVIPYGATVQASSEIQNGFRKVTYAGVTGWSSVAFLK